MTMAKKNEVSMALSIRQRVLCIIAVVLFAVCVLGVNALCGYGMPISAFAGEQGDATEGDVVFSITVQPSDAYVHVGKGLAAEFSIETNDDEATYQWQYATGEVRPAEDEAEEANDEDPDKGLVWADVSTGGESKTLSQTVTEENKDYQYRCMVLFSDSTEDDQHIVYSDVVQAIEPEITSHPSNVTALKISGTSVNFQVAANDPQATYLWEKSSDGGSTWKNSGAELSQSATLKVTLTEENVGWLYRCVVSFSDGVNTTSDSAGVAAILTQPEGFYAQEGDSATFSVEMTSSAQVVSYQWKVADNASGRNAKAISGASANSYTFDVSSSNIGKCYACTVTFSDGAKQSSVTTSWVHVDTITKQPTDSTDYPDVTYVVATNDKDNPSYLWMYSEDAGTTWCNFSEEEAEEIGADSEELSLSLSEEERSRVYRCTVTFSDGVVAYSRTVGLANAIIKQPVNQPAEVGGAVTFKVDVRDAGATFVWERSDDGGITWAVATDAGSSSSVLTVVVSEQNFDSLYRCKVTFADGSVEVSDSARATCKITQQPVSVMGVVGGTAKFSVTTNGGEGTKYAWEWSSDAKGVYTSGLEDEKLPTLSVDVTKETLGRYYCCVVTFPDGTVEVSQFAQIVTAACYINDNPYANLDDALAAARDGDTISLASDVECTTFSNGAKALTLDLRGHMLKGSIQADEASLTITDSVGTDGTRPTVTGLVSGSNLHIEGGVYNQYIGGTSPNDISPYVNTDRHVKYIVVVLDLDPDKDKVKYESDYQPIGAMDREGKRYEFDLSIVEAHSLVGAKTECGDVDYYRCSVCAKEFSDETAQTKFDIAQYRHDLKVIAAVLPTCTSTGNNEYRLCSRCGKAFKDSMAQVPTTVEAETLAPTHSKQYLAAKDPTCTEAGISQGYWWCYKCGETYWDEDFTQPMDSATVAIPALGHDWSDWTIITPATCEEHGEGLRAHTCNRCGETETETIPIADHTLVKVDALAATCTASGTKEYYQCSVCGLCFEDADGTVPTSAAERKIPALGHLYGKVEAREANCTEFACIEHYECMRCGKYFFKNDNGTYAEASLSEIWLADKLGHSIKYVAPVEPTCTAYGNYEYYKCSRCDALFSDAVASVSIKAAEVSRDPLGHSLEFVAYQDATSTADGCEAHYVCTRCGLAFSEDQTQQGDESNFVIPALGVSDSGDDSSDDDTTPYIPASASGVVASAVASSGTIDATELIASEYDSWDFGNEQYSDEEDIAGRTLLDDLYDLIFDSEGAVHVEAIVFSVGCVVIIAACIALALFVRSGKRLSPRRASRYVASPSARKAAQMREMSGRRLEKSL